MSSFESLVADLVSKEMKKEKKEKEDEKRGPKDPKSHQGLSPPPNAVRIPPKKADPIVLPRPELKRSPPKQERKLEMGPVRGDSPLPKKAEKKDKIVICASRSLSESELIILNRMFTVLEFKSSFHAHRKPKDLLFELMIFDFMDKDHLGYYNIHKPWFSANCQIVSLQIPGKKLSMAIMDKLKLTYSFDTIIKSIARVTDKEELINSLLSDHLPQLAQDLSSKCFRCLHECKKN